MYSGQMAEHRPCSPFTALFRSVAELFATLGDPDAASDTADAEDAIGHLARGEPAPDLEDVELGRQLAARQIDRKSTRLNSSHPSSSYAVSCSLIISVRQPFHIR